MDDQAAIEFHAALHERLGKYRSRKSGVDYLFFLVAFGAAGYFALNGVPGAIFGGMIGWAINAVFLRIDQIRLEVVYMELLRHLHEYTDEAEAGKARAEIQEVVRQAAKKWWQPL